MEGLMGSYTDFSIGGYDLLTSKSYVEPVFMTVFKETDKKITPVEVDGDKEIDQHRSIRYAVSASIAKERLGVMGFSLRKTRLDFDREKKVEAEYLEEVIQDQEEENRDLSAEDAGQLDVHNRQPDPDEFLDSWLVGKQKELDLLRRSTFDDFLDGFRFLNVHSLSPYLPQYQEIPSDVPELVRFMLSDDEDRLLRFPCTDPRFLIRAFLETAEDEEEVVQDISSVVDAGYYDDSDSVCEQAIESLIADYPVNQRIIILTEGSTDSSILDRSLRLLFPHLAGYYTFMDFEASNAAGSAGVLVGTIKAFAGAGITNRVIALFDNDTAAEDAIRGLKKTKIPDNIRFAQYPPIEIAKTYPSIGPGGMLAEMDINGLACSLELYFGVDVLRSEGGMTPIQWTGYNRALNRYQGEILDKDRLIEGYRRKLDDCEADTSRIDSMDFGTMRLLLREVFAVFQ
ncbi:MAG: HEPN/Toprim-associated domain-containing protein [Terriglobales bacterium]